MTPEVGVIGGSGLYGVEEFDLEERRSVSTPFGEPSDPIVLGRVESRAVAFLPRHGRDHSLLPSEVNSRANVFALKELGVRRIVAVGAVGSLQPDHRPRELAVPDQIVDRTTDRKNTFFGRGLVAHVGLTDPFCPHLRAALASAGDAISTSINRDGTYLCIEGPQFSTRAESRLYRSFDADYIGMTLMPEARLAREAEICYAAVGMITDYDAWKPGGAEGDPAVMMENLRVTTEAARTLMASALPELDLDRSCGCESALEGSLITDREAVPPERRHELEPLIGSYWPVD